VTLEGKEGFISDRGKFLFTTDESAWYHGFREGLALARYGFDSWGFIDKTGKQVIGPYAKADLDCYDDFSEGLVCVKTKEKYGYMNKDEEMVIEPQFDFARSFSQGVAIVGNLDEDSGRKSFWVINKKCEIIAGPNNEWDMIKEFSEGLAEVEIDDRYGYVNTDLEVVIRPIYDVTRGYFKGGIVEAIDEENGISGFIDQNNTWVWSREEGRSLVFMFRATTKDKIAQSIEAFGAIPLEWKTMFLYPDIVKTSDMASPTWLYPEREAYLLAIGLEEDLEVAYISMTMDLVGEWSKFEDVLYKNANPPSMLNVLRSSAVLYVYIKPGRDAENALREFALHMLDANPGIVADFYHDHAWTLEEIKKDTPWNGIHFLRPHRREEAMTEWRNHPRLKGKFHPEYPDDIT